MLKKAQGVGLEKTQAEKRAIVNALKSQHKLPLLLKIMVLPCSTFYYAPTEISSQDSRAKILALHQENGGYDGYRMIHAKLQAAGIFISEKTVLSHMQALSIRSNVKVKRRHQYGKTSYIAPNLLERDLTATTLKQKPVIDVTEFREGNEKLYLSPMMDLANREIITYHISRHPNFALVDPW
ncbi:IS3 family transposase [Pasteurella multocida]|uniref:IS3 family transposase n=1 Tax=Pasteurella multocida TaxID=747 RepID=UPI002BA08F2A|nr:IS3 family transposase [Pasteurella multocida]MEB3471539.1 IS3 family transposase [Pasteurella multocida]HDR1852162.1 IS3 family transposase [Pasteurella multocida]